MLYLLAAIWPLIVFVVIFLVSFAKPIVKHYLGKSTRLAVAKKLSADTDSKKTKIPNLFNMFGVLTILAICTYLLSGEVPTSWPAWKWLFFIAISLVIGYGGTAGKKLSGTILALTIFLGFWALLFGPESLTDKLDYLRAVDSKILIPQNKPGTYAVTAGKYYGRADGFYTIRDDQWAVFEWPTGYCVVADNPHPVLPKENDRADTYGFLSRKGTQRVEVRTLTVGERWDDFVCRNK